MDEPRNSETDPARVGAPAAPGPDGSVAPGPDGSVAPGPDGSVAPESDGSIAPVEVAVTRTGGFAGLTKRWVAEPGEAEASVWIELIAQCPWDAPGEPAAPAARVEPGAPAGRVEPGARPTDRTDPGAHPAPGADRFTWWIRARCGEQDEREAELPDDQLVGAWRALVDAVRDWSRVVDA